MRSLRDMPCKEQLLNTHTFFTCLSHGVIIRVHTHVYLSASDSHIPFMTRKPFSRWLVCVIVYFPDCFLETCSRPRLTSTLIKRWAFMRATLLKHTSGFFFFLNKEKLSIQHFFAQTQKSFSCDNMSGCIYVPARGKRRPIWSDFPSVSLMLWTNSIFMRKAL